MHTEANNVALASEENKSFIARSASKETGSRAQICLPDWGFSQTFLSWGKKAGMWKQLASGFPLEGFGIWPFRVKYGEGALALDLENSSVP